MPTGEFQVGTDVGKAGGGIGSLGELVEGWKGGRGGEPISCDKAKADIPGLHVLL